MEVEQKIENYICLKCSSRLNEDQMFCSKCGTKKGDKNNKICSGCNAVVAEGEKFCPKCGEKINMNIQSDIIQKIPKFKMNKNVKIVILIVIILTVFISIFSIKILPEIMITTTEMLADGDYVAAYKKANDEEKIDVLNENLLVTVSQDIIPGLKDPESFILREAWYDKEDQTIVAYITGNNSYGAKTNGYWIYKYKEEYNEFKYVTSLSSLEEEEPYSWQDSDEKLDILYDNLWKILVADIITKDNLKIKKESIDNINNLFQTGKIDNIELLEENKFLKSAEEKDA